MKNNLITNIDAKKAFLNFIDRDNNIPQIYLDEYWDYYISEFAFTEQWKTFLTQFINEGFTYESFEEEYYKLMHEVHNTFISLVNDKVEQKFHELLSHTNCQLPEIDIHYLPDGKYICVDLHNAFDIAFKQIGIYGNEYKDTYDIFNKKSNYDIFKNHRQFRLKLYRMFFANTPFNISANDVFNFVNSIILEKLYQSNNPIIQYLNDNFELVGKSNGDSFYYKLNENKYITNIIGDFEYEDIPYHIDILTFKNIKMFGNDYNLHISNDNDKITNVYLSSMTFKMPLSLYPFALKIATGEELNDKDLAFGYEDQIFFHWDKSEI